MVKIAYHEAVDKIVVTVCGLALHQGESCTQNAYMLAKKLGQKVLITTIYPKVGPPYKTSIDV